MSQRPSSLPARPSRSIPCLVIILMIASALMPQILADVGLRSASAEETDATPVSGISASTEPVAEDDLLVPGDSEGEEDEDAPEGPPPPLPEPTAAAVDVDTTGTDDPVGSSTEITGNVTKDDASPEAAGEPAPTRQQQMAPVEIAVEAEAEVPVSGTVTIAATDQYGTPLPGIEFRIPSPFGLHLPPLYSGYTDSAGFILVESLLLDAYMITVTQVSTPSGCFPAGSQAVELTTEIPRLNLHFVSICEVVLTGSVTMSATDQYGRPLPGIEFQIPSPYGTHLPPLFSGHTDARGLVVADSLLLDRYMITVTQMSAPAGCMRAGSQSVDLTFHVPDLTLHFVSTCEGMSDAGSVTISLTDQYGRPLPGIGFSKLSPIAYSPPRYEFIGTTDANGLILVESLLVDDYAVTFQQRSAPDGCTLAGDQTVVLSVDAPNPTLHFINACDVEPATGTLTIQTMDQDGNPLAGVEYQLLQDGIAVQSWVSTGAVLLVRGMPLEVSLTVHETAVPAGCAMQPDQGFTLTAADPGHAMAFIHDCTARAPEGSVTIVKIDQFFTRRGGAEFQLLQDGVVLDSSVTPTGIGEITFSGLSLDVPYTIHELFPPLGCTGAGDQTFTLTAAEPSQTLSISNECVNARGSITLTKTDQSGAPLPGVTFEVFSADGRLVSSVVTLPDGIARIPALPLTIVYTIHEVAAPEGCVAAADATVTLTTEARDQAMIVVNECEGADPDPSPSPSSTPGATVTATAASTATTSTTGPGPDDPSGEVVERESDAVAVSADSTDEPMVRALPKTGQGGASGDRAPVIMLLAVSGAMVLMGAGMRMRRG